MKSLNNKRVILIHCNIVTEQSVLLNHALIIENRVIKAIIEENQVSSYDADLIDCKGCYVLPGFIDIHCDVIEKIIVPRKGVVFDSLIALNEIDRELLMQGITTIYHSISIAETTVCNNRRTLQLKDIFDLCELIYKHNKDLIINHKFHARFEMNSIHAFDSVFTALCNNRINELSFMDHTPGQGQYKNIDVFKRVIQQQYGMISDKKQNEIIDVCTQKPKLAPNKLQKLIHKAVELKVPLAYHDVNSTEQIDWMMENQISICEFPLTSEIAEYATSQGLCTIMGAPNIVLGRSHYNNANAALLLLNHWANTICSDYFSPSLLLAVFALSDNYKIPLYDSVKFATLNPAKAVHIEDKYGSIEVGKVADLIVVNHCKPFPKIMKTLIAGEVKLEVNT